MHRTGSGSSRIPNAICRDASLTLKACLYRGLRLIGGAGIRGWSAVDLKVAELPNLTADAASPGFLGWKFMAAPILRWVVVLIYGREP